MYTIDSFKIDGPTKPSASLDRKQTHFAAGANLRGSLAPTVLYCI